LKDISADRETGYRTFPVVFGWLPTAIYSDLTAVAVAALTGTVILMSGTLNFPGMTIFAVAIFVNLFAQVHIHRTRDEGKSHKPIASVVRAFVLYCVAIIVTLKLNWLVFTGVYYTCFELTLKLRPEKTQV